jgi:1,4-dihydroxy-2-naphthoate octaprenyltransferase
MSIARHGTAVGALASQVHPVFMLPALATAVFGAVLAGSLRPGPLLLHLGAVFFGLYTAHVTDGYVDFYRRGEDDDHPLTRQGCHLARLGATVGFALALLALFALVDIVAVLVTLPGWIIAVLHAPTLDTTPLGATVGYPAGVSLAFLGGYYVQAGALPATPLSLAVVFLIVLAGIKVIDDAQDHAYDRSIDKRTVAVALGPTAARRVAHGLMAVGMGLVVALTLTLSGIPPSAALSVLAFGGVALVARRAEPELATMLLVRGSYLFLAVLVAAVWFRPLV